MPKVSIIVPVYQVEKYLEKCVDSILAQTLADIEVLLVDDGSDDSCGTICDRYQRRDERVRVIHKRNGGISDARNAALDIATGEYIGFVDGDDHIEADMFEYLYRLCIEHGSEMSACNMTLEYEGGWEPAKPITENRIAILSPVEFYREMMRPDRLLRMNVWNKLYRADLFRNVRFPAGKAYEDVGTVYKAVFRCSRISYGSYRKYHYLIRGGSTCQVRYSRLERDRYEMTNRMLEYIRTNEPSLLQDAVAYRMTNCFLTIANKMISSNYYDKRFMNELRAELRKDFAVIFRPGIRSLKRIQLVLLAADYHLYCYSYRLVKALIRKFLLLRRYTGRCFGTNESRPLSDSQT